MSVTIDEMGKRTVVVTIGSRLHRVLLTCAVPGVSLGVQIVTHTSCATEQVGAAGAAGCDSSTLLLPATAGQRRKRALRCL